MSVRKSGTRDEEFVEVPLSKSKTVYLRALDGWTTTLAERIARAIMGESSPEEMSIEYPIVVAKVYAVGSIAKINDMAVEPLSNKIEYVRVSKLLNFEETQALMAAFMERMGPPAGAELKNS